MASTDVTGQILELLKKSPDAMTALQRVLNTFCSANITKPDPGEFFPTDEDQYMALMMGALEYSIFPHAIKPALGQLVGAIASFVGQLASGAFESSLHPPRSVGWSRAGGSRP